MITVLLAAVPNQRLSIELDNSLYDLTIKETNGTMGVTIVRNDVVIVNNIRAVAGAPLLPYLYLENGNFIFITNNDEYPYYTEFGNTQFLLFASQAELEVIRGT